VRRRCEIGGQRIKRSRSPKPADEPSRSLPRDRSNPFAAIERLSIDNVSTVSYIGIDGIADTEGLLVRQYPKFLLPKCGRTR
jgi:hypothetical protein